jgi:hypothetical protein
MPPAVSTPPSAAMTSEWYRVANDNFHRNLCTVDTCDPLTGCHHSLASCNDQDACTTDTCDSKKGCLFTLITLPTTDKCSSSYCDSNLGIITDPIVCRPTSTCKCDPQKGCVCSDCKAESKQSNTPQATRIMRSAI